MFCAKPLDAAKWHRDMDLPLDGEVFVFGSNLAGIHGAGAARVACERFGAVIGHGIGYQGHAPWHSYAIPTKDAKLRVLQSGHARIDASKRNAPDGTSSQDDSLHTEMDMNQKRSAENSGQKYTKIEDRLQMRIMPG